MAINGTHENSTRWQVDPQGSFRLAWDIVLAVLCLYVSVSIPYRTGFQVELCVGSAVWLFQLIVDLFFALDIILTFRTPIVAETGHIERSSAIIAKSYLRGWFFVDMLAVLPVSYIALLVGKWRAFCDTYTHTRARAHRIRTALHVDILFLCNH